MCVSLGSEYAGGRVSGGFGNWDFLELMSLGSSFIFTVSLIWLGFAAFRFWRSNKKDRKKIKRTMMTAAMIVVLIFLVRILFAAMDVDTLYYVKC